MHVHDPMEFVCGGRQTAWMDLVGLAALLVVPATLVSAVAGPLRDRGLWARLGRVEKQLASGTASSRARKMLENTRDHLIERIAMRELRPRWLGWWEFSGWMLGLAVAALVGFLVDGYEGQVKVILFCVGIGAWAIALLTVNLIRFQRESWLRSHRDDAYDRASDPLT